MKKLFFVSIIIGIILCGACTSVFAEEHTASSYTTSTGKTFGENTDDPFARLIHSDRKLNELPPDRIELTDEEKLKMAQEHKAQYDLSDDPENYTVLCFKTLSNGMKLVFVESKDWAYPDVVEMSPLGKYAYHHGGGRTVKLYKNGVYTEFLDAYNSGMIDDAMVEEINDVIHFDRYAEQTATTQPATGDSATPDSVYSSGSGGNGTIATGDNTPVGIIIAVALVAAAGIGFTALRRKV